MAINIVERNGKTTTSVRYYISSRFLSGKRFAAVVRGHWGIDSRLHLQLDVSFHADHLRLRRGRAAENMSIMMRTALSLLKREKTVRRGIATKRKRAGWDTT